jgi:hypothetical protein
MVKFSLVQRFLNSPPAWLGWGEGEVYKDCDKCTDKDVVERPPNLGGVTAWRNPNNLPAWLTSSPLIGVSRRPGEKQLVADPSMLELGRDPAPFPGAARDVRGRDRSPRGGRRDWLPGWSVGERRPHGGPRTQRACASALVALVVLSPEARAHDAGPVRLAAQQAGCPIRTGAATWSCWPRRTRKW